MTPPSALTKQQRSVLLSSVFTPSSPVTKIELFAGRLEQVTHVLSSLHEPGRHVVLYGERGVGKTSLASLLSDLNARTLRGDVMKTAKINCSTNDSFTSIWRRMLQELHIDPPERWTYGTPDPDEIRRTLQDLPQKTVLIFDEFDRLEDDELLTLMADTIKAVSDHTIEAKIVLVGVADSIEQLIGEHESIQRAIAEVAVPRMNEQEVFELLDRGYGQLNMAIGEDLMNRISSLSEGLPMYAHLLALHAGRNSLADDREEILINDIKAAIYQATQDYSLLAEYQQAVQSPKSKNIFSQVLTACAMAKKNRVGQFTAASVREPLSKIMGRPYDIPAFARHLSEFTEAHRGSVLKREGLERRRTYRFRNPLLQPFAIMTALSEDWMPEDLKKHLLG